MSKRIITLAVLGAAFIAGPASATIWQYNGVITTCNVDICNLVPIASGDPVVGSIEIDVGASDSFTLDTDPTGLGGLLDLIDFSFLVGGVIPVDPVAALDGSPPPCGPAGEPNQCDGVIITGGGTTDASGDFASGTMEGDFLGGTLGGLGGEVSICIEPAGCGAYDIGGFAGTLEQYDMLVTVGCGTVFVTEVEGCMDQPGSVDSDCDAVLNTVDNCTNVANADQI
ncbi:MAG: hypothetical protein OEQ74_10555, partial [Gammaproteobacteria bacterium]|nr:hypothetical protein [Gammaproteobacteria bacterium]